MVKKRGKKTSGGKKSKLSDEDRADLKFRQKEAQLEDSIIRKIKGFLHLHMDNYASKHGIRIEGSLFVLNFLVIVIFIIETHGPTGLFKSILAISEISIISIFIVEYIARMWIAEKRIKHFFNIYSLIDLVSILPIMVHFANLSFFRAFRILRMFRMLRVLRFQRVFKSKKTMFGQLSDSQLIIIRIVITIFTIILIASGLIWTVENKVNPGQFGSIWEAMYFAVVTITTVGYGDIAPISWQGRAITIAMILSGIALIPWQLGKLIKVILMETSKTKMACKKCGLADHDKDSKYCRICGTKLRVKKRLEEENPED
tara:strand:- start:1412 stop:2356 length:945 start_codon:yes stop_codon:yes gene_type:complete